MSEQSPSRNNNVVEEDEEEDDHDAIIANVEEEEEDEEFIDEEIVEDEDYPDDDDEDLQMDNDNEIYPLNSNEEANDNDNNAETNYDLSLPVEHSYLGNLDSVQSGRHLFTPGSILNMKTVYLDGIFLCPGQEIPLTFKQLVRIRFIESIISSNQLIFGIRVGSFKDFLGTTAEIRSYSLAEEQVSVKIVGRQRFKIIDSNSSSLPLYEMKIKILHDIDLCDFHRPLIQSERRLSKKVIPYLTQYTKQTLNQYDSSILMEKLKSILKKIFESRIKNYEFSFPLDPTAFSYFVLMTIPFDEQIKTRLFKIDCVNIRLRLENALLDSNFKFICCTCCTDICDRDSFLVMSKLGVSGTFVNNHGHLHELYTFSSLFRNTVRTISNYCEDFSWFPNYGWLIINCARCQAHLGWEFQTKKPNIHPKKFYALTKNSIRLAWTATNPNQRSILKFIETGIIGFDEDPNEIFRNGVPGVDY